METAERIAEYAKKLEEISYFDWLKLRQAIDEMFRAEKHEHERQLTLASAENAEKVTRSLFG